ncbi:glycosyltransferase [Sporomusa acidovorans]|uniref:Glycosyltransferase 2-like domain-containing protein n=1 Tax=Sporomusa acidovorans (strain ATCC 49682 / DSM 3132 / Mol) TaxID=1123286 RepID=A0ABZ3IYA8_SPOA4|nr:glycosyltransferase family 2 protein [Sporomusa acidovorans]OZC22418.1 SPBc2 prophage-derived glycosyltransferase SunS [Sporomusa acidovorans DSM 3132]SDE48682.1 Glycosyltransferase involved in cell wall bisynthesis [Sporomusa acidovorans]
MAKISACVITKNEAKNIQRCLQSVKNIVNEIIVVDTGSDDATVSIAERFGAKIFHYQWDNDFAAARNYALTQAKGAWIIFLDADEYITAETIKNVRPVIDKIHSNRKVDAIRCQMNNLEGIDGLLRSSNPSIRIFRNSPVIRYKGRVHEAIYKCGKPVNLINVTNQLIVIYHTGYTNKTIIEKIRRNTVILEAEVKSGVVRDLTYCYLSDGCWRNGQYEKSIEYAKKAIKQLARLSSELDYKPYVFLISSMTHLKTYSEEEVIANCNEAIERFPHHPEIWLFQGLYYRSIGRCEQALTSLLKAIETNACYSDFNRNNDFHALSPDAYLNVAQIYEMKNQSAQAFDCYTKVLQREKYNQNAFNGLVSIIRKQDPAEVIYFLNTLYNIAAEGDIRFLVTNLSHLKVKKVLDYYQQILLDKFGDNKLNGLVLLMNCKFENVFPVLADSFRKHGNYDMELLAVVSLLIGRRPDSMDLLGPQMKTSFRKIITAYFQIDSDIQLTDDDFPLFCDLVREMIYLASQQQMETLLQLGKNFFSDDAYTQISTILMQQRFFDYAVDMILNYINRASLEAKQLSLLYCDAGYCCYKLKDFAGASKYFSQALEFGYNRHYIFDFLEWSYQQCPDEAIKEKLMALKELYSNRNG